VKKIGLFEQNLAEKIVRLKKIFANLPQIFGEKRNHSQNKYDFLCVFRDTYIRKIIDFQIVQLHTN